MAGQLPDDIVQSIAISNAKSISEQPEMLSGPVEPTIVASDPGPLEARSDVGDDHVRLGDLELRINGQGQLVVVPMNSRPLDISVPGTYSRENIQVIVDSSRGITLRLRKDR
ncbi:hypothetical protein [Pinirhizobacter soli]|uniref:hypothetical protein n=1 Tax=Pinirhizobacter soli TaxID=2786953 RepID=UPI002029EF54|nr:hypothetical protein [Pinirhizobacter soli]